MKKIFLLILLAIFITSCEDVINVDLKTEKPRLVIDASINWEKGTLGNKQSIKLSTTTGFYDTEIPTVSNAIVTITDSQNRVFNFIESNVLGKYDCDNFIPSLNENYILKVITNQQTYIASEKLFPIPEINKIENVLKNTFGVEQYEFKAYYNDPIDFNNFYMYRYFDGKQTFYRVDKDEFFQGNEFFSIFQNDEVKKDDEVTITHFGISETYYNYMNIILDIAGNSGGSPFQSPPATVKGNVINQTDPANFALGYFRLSEVDSKSILVE
jgi:hypothetical protein